MGKRIMICDDAAFMRTILKNILVQGGYEVAGEAEDGQDGIEKYKALSPDLVLMDITMPIMDGIDSLRGIMSADSNAKVIMCSAMGQQSMVVAAIQAGAKDFIIKPFEPDRVLDAIKKEL